MYMRELPIRRNSRIACLLAGPQPSILSIWGPSEAYQHSAFSSAPGIDQATADPRCAPAAFSACTRSTLARYAMDPHPHKVPVLYFHFPLLSFFALALSTESSQDANPEWYDHSTSHVLPPPSPFPLPPPSLPPPPPGGPFPIIPYYSITRGSLLRHPVSPLPSFPGRGH